MWRTFALLTIYLFFRCSLYFWKSHNPFSHTQISIIFLIKNSKHWNKKLIMITLFYFLNHLHLEENQKFSNCFTQRRKCYMARNPGILFKKPSLIPSAQYYGQFFWLIGDRIKRVPLYFNHSNGSFHVRREHVFLFVCLFVCFFTASYYCTKGHMVFHWCSI